MANLHHSALEVVVAAGVLLVVVSAALSYMQTATLRAQLSEVAALTSAVRADVVVFRAEHGHWPEDAEEMGNGEFLDRNGLGRFTRQLDLRGGGAITATLREDNVAGSLAGRRLTYRPATSVADTGPSVVWVCGNAETPEGMTAAGNNETDIEDIILQFTCRGVKSDGEPKAD